MTPPEIRTFTASDGYRLHYRHWRPADAVPRARIVALHGIQSHSGWYGYSCGRLALAGFEVVFLDRRGAGMNEKDRGHVVHQDRWISDVCQVLGEVRAGFRSPEYVGCSAADGVVVPTVLAAVSWGGKLATVVAARRPDLVDGLVLLYPGLCSNVRPRWDQSLRLSLADALGMRRKRVSVPLDDPALFTGDLRWQEYIHHDPLGLRHVTSGFLIANRELDRMVPGCLNNIRCPALLMLAGRDQIIDNAATRQYFSHFSTTDRTEIEYPDAQHTLEFEPDRDRFIDDLIVWLNGRFTPAS